MSAIFWVKFDNGELVSVNSADAKSMKPKHLREATRKAVAKAKEKLHKTVPGSNKAKVVSCRCVG